MQGGGEASVHNASVGGSINTSFASVLGALGDAVAATPSRSLSIMRSAVRAAIPKNFVKDRARAIEGIPAMEGVLDEGSNGGGGAKGKGKAAVPVESISSGRLSEHVFFLLVLLLFIYLFIYLFVLLTFVMFRVFGWKAFSMRAMTVRRRGRERRRPVEAMWSCRF